jgi:hormone-sensitive lipase
MQNHTRKWANELGLPIFSIDYRMPPEHPFPQAPQDCFVVYRFITQHIHHYLNVRPTSVYLAGDSAGGNLACSLTGLILKNQELIPKGVYAVYPAADLRYIFTPSRLHAITDPLLWPSMLLLCLNSYMNGNFERANDPLASPVLLTEEFVSGAVGDQRFPLEWPKTIITAGSKDPLYDDSLVLMQRMVESDIDCECIVYEELSHGYLSTDLFVK